MSRQSCRVTAVPNTLLPLPPPGPNGPSRLRGATSIHQPYPVAAWSRSPVGTAQQRTTTHHERRQLVGWQVVVRSSHDVTGNGSDASGSGGWRYNVVPVDRPSLAALKNRRTGRREETGGDSIMSTKDQSASAAFGRGRQRASEERTGEPEKPGAFFEYWNQPDMLSWMGARITESSDGHATVYFEPDKHHRGAGIGGQAVTGAVQAYIFDIVTGAAVASLAHGLKPQVTVKLDV